MHDSLRYPVLTNLLPAAPRQQFPMIAVRTLMDCLFFFPLFFAARSDWHYLDLPPPCARALPFCGTLVTPLKLAPQQDELSRCRDFVLFLLTLALVIILRAIPSPSKASAPRFGQ